MIYLRFGFTYYHAGFGVRKNRLRSRGRPYRTKKNDWPQSSPNLRNKQRFSKARGPDQVEERGRATLFASGH
jgi:hypothetical protein